MADRFARWRAALATVAPVRLTHAKWYRLIASKYREEISSDRGAFLAGGRHNPPEQFGALHRLGQRLSTGDSTGVGVILSDA